MTGELFGLQGVTMPWTKQELDQMMFETFYSAEMQIRFYLRHNNLESAQESLRWFGRVYEQHLRMDGEPIDFTRY